MNCQHQLKLVPVPMVTRRCKRGCCSVDFCPLQLSFGMTGHTFQGQSAGPVDENQPKSAVDVVIADPGTRTFEGNNPGTLYMLASRATTMGTGSLDSALYFSGPNMSRSRVLDLKHQKSLSAGGQKKLYKKVELREKWVSHLETKTIRPVYTEKEARHLIHWCKTFRMSMEELDEALSRREWRINMRKGVNF